MAGHGKEEDPLFMLLVLIGAILGIFYAVWYLFRVEILEGLRYLRMIELAPVALFSPRAAACVSWLAKAKLGATAIPLPQIYNPTLGCFGVEFMRHQPASEAINYYNLTPDSMSALNQYSSSFMKWVLMGVCLYYTHYAIFKSKKTKFKTRYNLEGFIKIQAKVWPVIAPIVNFNPTKHSARILGSTIPDKLPTFAEALSPEEWLSFNRIPVVNGIPDREMIRRAFVAQLGPRWEGNLQSLPPYMQGLIAAFALKGTQKRDESDDFLGRLSTFWSADKGMHISSEMMAEIRKILKDPEIGGKALIESNKYAYRTTALLGTLKWARFMGGVLASAQFLWLRGVDRDLWYSLNNLGRRSFHSEGAGAIAHFMAEEAAQKALPIPRMETAIITVNQYLAANQTPIPPREEPGQVKKA